MATATVAILPEMLDPFPRARTRRDGVWWLMIAGTGLMAAASLLVVWVSRAV